MNGLEWGGGTIGIQPAAFWLNKTARRLNTKAAAPPPTCHSFFSFRDFSHGDQDTFRNNMNIKERGGARRWHIGAY